MDSRKINSGDVEAMLARWRKGAGAEWRQIFQFRMEVHGQTYAADGNPREAWNALLLAYALGEPTPAWAMEYFAVCATGLHEMAHAASRGEKFEPKDSAHAVGMVSKGRGTVFPGEDEFDWLALAWAVRERIKRGCPGRC